MAKKQQQKTERKNAAVETVTKADHAKNYARVYEVLETKNARPVALVDCRFAEPGEKFRAIDVLCFPTQLDTLLAMEAPYVKAVQE